MSKKVKPTRPRKRSKASFTMRTLWNKRKQDARFPPKIACDIFEADENDINEFHNYCIVNENAFDKKILDNAVVSDESADTSTIIIHGKDRDICDPWDPTHEYDSILAHNLETEKEVAAEPSKINGHRIVDINHVISKTAKLQYYHSRRCTFGILQPFYEKREGLFSTFSLQCNFCKKIFIVESEKPHSDDVTSSTVNVSFVWGTLTSGSTYTQATDVISVVNIPPMSYSMFHKIEEELGDKWKDTLWKCMEEAGREELRLAIQNNQLTADGTPWICVHCDGGWSKRSYGHSYNALSGTAVVIGKVTGKVLFVGVRNKYCCICARSANMKQNPTKHVCFKNWETSSTSMEANIIVEAFNRSIDMHGLKYKEMIADGDSSVFSKLKKEVAYGNEIEKIDCVNHIVKNYGKALHNIKSTSSIPIAVRKALTYGKIKKLQQIVMYVAKVNEDPELLKLDIENSIYHVYGDHLNCSERYCNVIGHLDSNLKEKFINSGLVYHLEGTLETLLSKAHKMIYYENNNKAEAFMALLAKFNCGKRLNLIQRRSFEIRTYLAALHYNTGLLWQSDAYEEVLHTDVGEVFLKRMENVEKAKLRRKKEIRKKREMELADNDYGPNATEAPLSIEEYSSEYRRILKSLQVSNEGQWKIALATVGQFNNNVYINERSKRLTASNFGTIIKHKPNTSCVSILKRMLYSRNVVTSAIEYGKKNEEVALRIFERELAMPVQSAGLFVDTEHGFLGASPDGLIGEDGIIEIKCAHSLHIKKQDIYSAIQDNKQFCLRYNADGEPTLKETHNYFYQIQGQLNITRRNFCYFIIFINEEQPIFVQKIYRDERFWKEKMVPKLKQFFLSCYLPEKIQKYIQRGVPCTHQGMDM